MKPKFALFLISLGTLNPILSLADCMPRKSGIEMGCVRLPQADKWCEKPFVAFKTTTVCSQQLAYQMRLDYLDHQKSKETQNKTQSDLDDTKEENSTGSTEGTEENNGDICTNPPSVDEQLLSDKAYLRHQSFETFKNSSKPHLNNRRLYVKNYLPLSMWDFHDYYGSSDEKKIEHGPLRDRMVVIPLRIISAKSTYLPHFRSCERFDLYQIFAKHLNLDLSDLLKEILATENWNQYLTYDSVQKRYRPLDGLSSFHLMIVKVEDDLRGNDKTYMIPYVTSSMKVEFLVEDYGPLLK